MVDGLAASHAIVVAAKARGWHALEHTTFVAGFARYLGVSPFEREFREVVVKRLIHLD